jgi:hypothetical protein
MGMKGHYLYIFGAFALLSGLLDCHAFLPNQLKTPVFKQTKKLPFANPTAFSRGPTAWSTPRSSVVSTQLSIDNFSLDGPVGSLAASLSSYTGNVPFLQALGLNVVLFAAFQSKLRTMLTPTGFAHAMALGTLLWMTLGWRGWTLCVLYLLLGQLVTKVKFADKEKRGLAEGRGGRRGPENVW